LPVTSVFIVASSPSSTELSSEPELKLGLLLSAIVFKMNLALAPELNWKKPDWLSSSYENRLLRRLVITLGEAFGLS